MAVASRDRSVGLTKQTFGYGHLLKQLPGDSNAEKEKADAAIYAPPHSDSDEKSPSPPPSSTSVSGTSPPSKRRRLNPRSSRPVDLTSSPSNNKDPDPADIQRTVFSSVNGHPGTTEYRVPSSSLNSGTAIENDTDDIFPEYTASQKKASSQKAITYQSNIHKAAPVKPEKKERPLKQEKIEPPFKLSSNGFKTPDTERLEAMVPSPEKGHIDPAFKQPPGSSSSPRARRARGRSAQEESNGVRPARPKTFKNPPRIPDSPKRESAPPPQFKVPKVLSPGANHRRSSRSNRSSRNTSMPDVSLAPGLIELQGLANHVAVQARLKLDLKAPESSATTSSGPIFDFDMDDGNSSSSLSSAPGVEELDALDFHEEPSKTRPPSSPKSKCPLCKKTVSRLFLEEFSCSGNLNVRQQAKFCRAHKIRSAKDVWREKGYPSIAWNEFQARLPKYGDDLVGVLNDTQMSFYRNVLDDQIKSGKRTPKQLMMGGDDREGSKMGYYGTKGQRILMDYLMARFASRIRKLAGTDRLVSAAGVAGFVQGVLVPEMAVMLVKVDMQVDEEQARVILTESSEIGNLLNEEEDEVIKDEVEENV
ncbi:MAG: hypothetical protein Q9169_005629 [Polycauliona sp. 2 TL-2023]